MTNLPIIKPLRCAVYTRKSSEEGLEQEFNSLHAQREACEAYVASQKHEGWQLIQTAYDDGGFSGGSMARPALQGLLADIRASLIDVVVVYKVDRLSRSLADFAKMVELFDAHSVSFVSVTQAFSTTTSMGRLTLNMLLSFAQFEREVTGERIRDKIAASKAKGMWMGGVPPLGFSVVDRRLVVNAEEATHVRRLFDLYQTMQSADDVVKAAYTEGIRSKVRVTPAGEQIGGGKVLRGALYTILSNPLYVGEIPHKGKSYPGQHKAIIDRAMFDAVQATLADNRRKTKLSLKAKDPALLTGRVVGSDGRRLTSSHTRKGSKRYRYYAATTGASLRVPGYQLEQLVIQRLKDTLGSPSAVTSLIYGQLVAENALGLSSVIAAAAAHAKALAANAGSMLRETLHALVRQVSVSESGLTVTLNGSALGLQINTLSLAIESKLLARRGGLAIVLPSDTFSPRVDSALVAAVAQAQQWFEEVAGGATISSIALREGVTRPYVGNLLDLAFLAPDIVLLIIKGGQPDHMTATWLRNQCPLPAEWQKQRQKLLKPSDIPTQ